jgi:DNA-binding ferritin-like protein
VTLALFYAGCAKTKMTKEAHVKHLKAKMYDLDRKVVKAGKKTVITAKMTKKEKANAVKIKKDIETLKKDMEAVKERLDSIASVTAEAWDGFTSSLEQGMDKLNTGIETIIGTYKEKSTEETQPQ